MVQHYTDMTCLSACQVERYQLHIPTQDWITFLPPDTAQAYVLERSHVSKDRLGAAVEDAWSRRQLAPRVTKECRQHLKAALAAKTGLPCRIGLTGRCHLKPPFSRKKRAPLFVTNGYCGRKDGKCLGFKFKVQDFDPEQPVVVVDVEVRGTLLTGAEGAERHGKRSPDDPGALKLKRIAIEEVDAFELEPQTKRPRTSRKSLATRRSAAARAAHEAVQALRSDSWASELELQTAEVVLDEALPVDKSAAPSADGAVVNAVELLAAAEPVLGADATRELMEMASQALDEANAGCGPGPKYTATKIVQSGESLDDTFAAWGAMLSLNAHGFLPYRRPGIHLFV